MDEVHSLPSINETLIAALNVAENIYMLALDSLAWQPKDDTERQKLETSHTKFKAYFEDTSQLTALGEALLELPQSPRLGEALRTVVALATVRRAGGRTIARRSRRL